MNKKSVIVLSILLVMAGSTVLAEEASVSTNSTDSSAKVAQSGNILNRIFGGRGRNYNNSNRYNNDDNYRNNRRNNRYENRNLDNNRNQRRYRNNRNNY